MNTLLRAIITGFGFKLGSDLYTWVGKKIGLPFVSDSTSDGKADDDDDD